MSQLRSIQELLEVHDPAWPAVQSWIGRASNYVEVLPPDETQRNQVLVDTQLTTRSPMGAIVYHTGGLLIDNGWLRLLGSGHPKLPRSMSSWNRGRSTTSDGRPRGFWLIGDDVIGGFFALDGGALGPGKGHVFYFAPDTLSWELLNGMEYSEFLVWSLSPKLSLFYQSMRWDGWEREVAGLHGDQVFSIYPFLSTVEGKSIASCSRKPCPIAEIYSLHVGQLQAQGGSLLGKS